MKRALLTSVVILGLGVVGCGQGTQQQAESPPEPGAVNGTTATPTPNATPSAAPNTTPVAQEPNQDSLQMRCEGSITVNDIDFVAHFTREAGFSRIELKRRSSGQLIADTFLSFDRKNDRGEAIWRGSVNDMASVTLVHLSPNAAQIGDQVSVGYDQQWGRGTCR